MMFKTGRKKEAEQLCQVTKPSKFSFLTRKTNMSIYLYLSQCLEKNNGGKRTSSFGYSSISLVLLD
jgi:hypothetical protein